MADYLTEFNKRCPVETYTTIRDKVDATAVARIFGCTVTQAKAQYQKNADQLRQMAAHPLRADGKKLHGFTAADLTAKAAEFDRKAK